MLNNLNTQNQNTNTGSTAATFPPPIGTKINREEEISVAIEKLGINNPKQELNNLITQLNKADSNGTLLKDYTEDYTIQKVKRKIANDYKPEKISNALNEMNNMNNNYIKDIKKQIEDILDLIYTDVAEKYIKKQTGILKEEINKDIVNNKNNEVNLSGVKFSHTFTGYFVEKQGVKFFLDKETQESLSDKIVKNDEKTVAKEAISIYDKDLIKNLKSTNTKHATIKSLREFIHARSGKLFLEHNNNQIGIDQCNNLLDQSLVEALNNVKHYFIHKDISAEEVGEIEEKLTPKNRENDKRLAAIFNGVKDGLDVELMERALEISKEAVDHLPSHGARAVIHGTLFYHPDLGGIYNFESDEFKKLCNFLENNKGLLSNASDKESLNEAIGTLERKKFGVKFDRIIKGDSGNFKIEPPPIKSKFNRFYNTRN